MQQAEKKKSFSAICNMKTASRAVAGGVSANYLKGRAKGHRRLFLNQALQTVELIGERDSSNRF